MEVLKCSLHDFKRIGETWVLGPSVFEEVHDPPNTCLHDFVDIQISVKICFLVTDVIIIISICIAPEVV